MQLSHLKTLGCSVCLTPVLLFLDLSLLIYTCLVTWYLSLGCWVCANSQFEEHDMTWRWVSIGKHRRGMSGVTNLSATCHVTWLLSEPIRPQQLVDCDSSLATPHSDWQQRSLLSFRRLIVWAAGRLRAWQWIMTTKPNYFASTTMTLWFGIWTGRLKLKFTWSKEKTSILRVTFGFYSWWVSTLFI